MTVTEVRKAIKNASAIIITVKVTFDDDAQITITKSQALKAYKGMSGNIETAAFTMPDGRLYI